VVIGAAVAAALGARADTFPEGETILLPVNWKLVGVEMKNKKPMALIRLMRDDEHPEVWVFKPLETLNSDESQLGAEPAIVIKESTDRIKKQP